MVVTRTLRDAKRACEEFSELWEAFSQENDLRKSPKYKAFLEKQ